MSYITTVTGIHFDPVNPDDRLIDIYDIAHSLSLICRANGHIKHFYSVGQHSLACAKEAEQRGCSREVILGCLLHDASEAYLSDVTRPVKKDLSYYLEVEERLQDLIWKHFIGRNIYQEERKQIFEIDDQMLSMEFHQLMPEDINEDYRKLILDVNCSYRNHEEVRKDFLSYMELIRPCEM
jgi:5'-deoxynucleotidase YfbR-like HD superfamily hydrolase